MRGIPQLSKASLGEDTCDIHYYMSREYEDIRQANADLPSLIVWLGELRGWCYKRLIDAESAWKEAEGKAYFALKTGGEYQARGFGDKATEEGLKHAIQLDPTVRSNATKYAECKRRQVTVEETIEAVKLKIDLIRSSETTRRMVADEPLPKQKLTNEQQQHS